MRIPKYISPSAFQLFYTDPIKYYLRYLATVLDPREPANIHMAMGSAFDALVKAQITADLQTTTRFDERELFELQVPYEFRYELWPKAKYLLSAYKECGAYGVAVSDMGLASLEPRFEFDVNATIRGVPVFGKPDAFYHNKNGIPVVLDWKVNSFLGGSNMKKKFYVSDHQTGEHHPDIIMREDSGLRICVSHGLEDTDKSWAFQQMIYAIGLGSEIGDPFITSIDQATGGPSFYTYRAHLKKAFQFQSVGKLKQMWEDINTGYVFRSIGKTREESDALIQSLEGPSRYAYM